MDPNRSCDLRWLPRPPGVSTVAIVMDLSLSGFPSRTAASAGTVALGGAEVSAAARSHPLGARRDDAARQPPARTKPPPAAGTARRRRTAYEGCSGMTVAFVAPSPSEGARRDDVARQPPARDEVPFRRGNGSETANRVRRVFGDDRGLRGPQSVRRGATAMMSLQNFVDCVV